MHPALAAATLLMVAAAHAEPLNVKPGLWEITTVFQRMSHVKPSNLDQVPPEKRGAVMEKLGKSGTHTSTKRSCLSEAQLASGEAFQGGRNHGNCKRSTVTQTAQEWVTKIECTGNMLTNAEITMKASDPEHISGLIAMSARAGSQHSATRSEISGKWLGDKCPGAQMAARRAQSAAPKDAASPASPGAPGTAPSPAAGAAPAASPVAAPK